MSATQTLTRAPNSLQGNSSGGVKGRQAFDTLAQGKPLSIASLLESAVQFVEQQHKRTSAQEIPYEPINVKVNTTEQLNQLMQTYPLTLFTRHGIDSCKTATAERK